MPRVLVTILALSLTAAACSGGDASGTRPGTSMVDTSMVESATTAMQGTPDTSTTAVTPTAECALSAAPLAAGLHTLDLDGVEREFHLSLPAMNDEPAPVILDFHGSGSDLDQQLAYSLFADRGTERGYVVITPNGTGTPRGWSLRGPGTDDAFVDALLDAVGAGTCIDRDHVFATGISNGSAYSALMACREPFRVAAVGMVAATLPSLCPIEHPIPAIAFHGTDDRVVPYGGGTINSSGNRDGMGAPGAEGSIGQWAERNGCGAPTDSDVAPDVVERTWADCPPGAEVRFYSVRGGGHTWPGGVDVEALGLARLGATTQSISATDILLDFFDDVRSR